MVRLGNRLRAEAPPPKSIIRTVNPTVDPIELTDVKEFLRISSGATTHDSVLRRLIKSQTQFAENWCKRAFIEQTWRVTFDAFLFDFFSIPDIPRIVTLPRPRLISLEEVEFFKEDGTTELFTLTDLIIDTNSEPGRVVLKPGKVWPSGLRDIDAVHFTYKAGYGPTADDIDDGIKEGIRRLIATKFENRESIVIGKSVGMIPTDWKSELQPFKIFRLF